MQSGYIRAIVDLTRNYCHSLSASQELQKAACDQTLPGRSEIYAEQARFELEKAHGYLAKAKILISAAEKAGLNLEKYRKWQPL